VLRLPVLEPTKNRKLISSFRAGMVVIQNGDVFEETGKFLGPAPEILDGLSVEKIREFALSKRPKDFGPFEGPPPNLKRRGRPRKLNIAPSGKEKQDGVGLG
jgi:hypothetical protein